MLVRLSTLWFGFCLLWSFNLSFYKLPEEVSRKHGSRNKRLARTDVYNDTRPDVSHQTSRKARRLATNVSQGVSQGQRSRDRRFARTDVPTSLFSSYFSSMLVRLSTLWFGFCLV